MEENGKKRKKIGEEVAPFYTSIPTPPPAIPEPLSTAPPCQLFQKLPSSAWTQKKDDQTIRRGRRTTDDPGTPPRPSGSPSGGEGIPAWTRHIFSHPERGQGGPGGESADRYGDGGAAEARGLEDTQEGCESQLPGGSNGSRILAPTSVSVGWKTLRGGL